MLPHAPHHVDRNTSIECAVLPVREHIYRAKAIIIHALTIAPHTSCEMPALPLLTPASPGPGKRAAFVRGPSSLAGRWVPVFAARNRDRVPVAPAVRGDWRVMCARSQ